MMFLERIAENYRKIALGFGVTTAFTSAIFAVFGNLIIWEKFAIAGAVYFLCGVAAYAWTMYSETGFLRSRITIDDAISASLVVRPEDHLAHVAATI